MKQSTISASAQSYLDSLRKETRKLYDQRLKENISSKKKVKKSETSKTPGKSSNIDASLDFSEINTSLESDVFDDISVKANQNNTNNPSKNVLLKNNILSKQLSVSRSSNETSNNKKDIENISDEIVESSQNSTVSIPAEKYFKMIRHSIDTSLFMGTKNEVNSNEISPLSSKSDISETDLVESKFKKQNIIKNKLKPDISRKQISQREKNKFKIGNIINKSGRQETILELDDVLKKISNDSDSVNQKPPVAFKSVFRKQNTIQTKDGITGGSNNSSDRRNTSKSSSSIPSEINSISEEIKSSVVSSLSSIISQKKGSERSSTSLSNSSFSSTLSEVSTQYSSSSVSTSSTTQTTHSSTSETSSSESMSSDSSDSTLTSLSVKEIKRKINNEQLILNKASSLLSELSDHTNQYSKNDNISSIESLSAISNNEKKNIVDNTKEKKEYFSQVSDDSHFLKMKIEHYKRKLEFLNEKTIKKSEKDEVLDDVVLPYITVLQKYFHKETKVSELIEKSLFECGCKDSLSKALANDSFYNNKSIDK
uniref:GRIP domain-containing protein n=1 Tax=Parastrongyloides trichosuri TaxID=131310 RepID=A0A0N5A3R7_PARTI